MTYANMEIALIRRLGPLMRRAGLDTRHRDNPDLAAAIAWALHEAGAADVPGAPDPGRIVDLAELALLEEITLRLREKYGVGEHTATGENHEESEN